MGRVKQRRFRYPEPKRFPWSKAIPFVAALLMLVVAGVGLAITVDRMINWPTQTEIVDTHIYRAPPPQFSAQLDPSKAQEDSATFSNESDWAIGWNGRFFTQTNGQPEGTSRQGFSVTDDGDFEFWQAYIDLGGRRVLGFPLSRRFVYQGRVTQVFQRAVLQWDAGIKSTSFVNMIDDVQAQGRVDWLMQQYQVPPPLPADYDRGKGWNDVVRGRLELLAVDGTILGAYYSVPDPITLYGLPTSRVEDRGAYYVVQLQRAIIRHWKIDSEDPRAGQIQVIGAGEIGMQSGIFPAEAFVPEDPPPTGQ